MNFFLVAKAETLAEATVSSCAAQYLKKVKRRCKLDWLSQYPMSRSCPYAILLSVVHVMLDSIALAIQTMGAFSMLMGGIIMVSVPGITRT